MKRRRVVKKGETQHWISTRFLKHDTETEEMAKIRLERDLTDKDTLIDAGVTEYVSFGHCNVYRCAMIPRSVLTTAWSKFKRAKEAPVASVESYLRAESRMFPFLAWWANNRMSFTTMATLLIDAFIDCPTLFEIPLGEMHAMLPPPNNVSYTPYRGQVIEDEPCVVRSLLPPGAKAPFLQAVGPTRGVNSDAQCIEGRITSIRNFANGTVADEVALDNFIDNLLKTAGVSPQTLTPTDFDHVFEKQKRPTQRRILAMAESWFSTEPSTFKSMLKTFMKGEAYGKITDPRNITTISGTVKMNYSRYTYALQSVMKHQSWYAFSKSPRELGRAINSLLAGKDNVVPTDFSRWDGRVSEWLTKCFLRFLKRSFGPEYHSELESLYNAQYCTNAVTANGLKYKHLFDMPSGSPHTSIKNTFLNAFVNYLARIDSGESFAQAWKGLGIYGGDDGLTPNISTSTLERTCERLGLKVKAKALLPGDPVDFLGRIFHNGWVDQGEDGAPSHIDVARQLGKLYVTASPKTVPDPEVLVRKAQGYLITDSRTPVLSNWARAVCRVYPAEAEAIGAMLKETMRDKKLVSSLAGDSHSELLRDFNWFATFLDNDGRFNNSGINNDDVLALISGACKFSSGELSAISKQFDDCANAGDLFRVGLSDPTATITVEVDARHGDDIKLVDKMPNNRGKGVAAERVQPTGGEGGGDRAAKAVVSDAATGNNRPADGPTGPILPAQREVGSIDAPAASQLPKQGEPTVLRTSVGKAPTGDRRPTADKSGSAHVGKGRRKQSGPQIVARAPTERVPAEGAAQVGLTTPPTVNTSSVAVPEQSGRSDQPTATGPSSAHETTAEQPDNTVLHTTVAPAVNPADDAIRTQQPQRDVAERGGGCDRSANTKVVTERNKVQRRRAALKMKKKAKRLAATNMKLVADSTPTPAISGGEAPMAPPQGEAGKSATADG